MEIDSTPLEVVVIHDDGTVDRCELTGLIDLATRTLAAVVLRPSTKAVDAALLLADAMTPEPVRPGWSDALRMSRSVLPCASLLSLDERLGKAAAVPVDFRRVVSDHGKAFISDNFRNACRHLGISFQPAHPDTPTDRPHIERTLGSVSTMFAQYVAGYTGRSAEMRGKDPSAQAAWSIHELQELLQEWIVVWQARPHDGLHDPLMPDRPWSPNEKYAALVSAAGYVPVSLSREECIQLMPREFRVIGRSGVRINNRTTTPPASPLSGVSTRGRSGRQALGGPLRPLRHLLRLGTQSPLHGLDHRDLAPSAHVSRPDGRAGLRLGTPDPGRTRAAQAGRGSRRTGGGSAFGPGLGRTRSRAWSPDCGEGPASPATRPKGRCPHPGHQRTRLAADGAHAGAGAGG
ncbi:hypothetical protein [Streptomyces sp. NPDC001774]